MSLEPAFDIRESLVLLSSTVKVISPTAVALASDICITLLAETSSILSPVVPVVFCEILTISSLPSVAAVLEIAIFIAFDGSIV